MTQLHEKFVLLGGLFCVLIAPVAADKAYYDPTGDVQADWVCTGSACSTGHYAVLDDEVRQPDTPDTGDDYLSDADTYDEHAVDAISESNINFITLWAYLDDDSEDVTVRLKNDGSAVAENTPNQDLHWEALNWTNPSNVGAITAEFEKQGLDVEIYSWYIEVDYALVPFVIHNPMNQTYSSSNVDLEVTSDNTINTWQYSLDGNGNHTFSPNTTLSGLSNGGHSVTVWAEMNAGTWEKEETYFTIDANQPPTVTASANTTSGEAPLPVDFSASASDSDGSISSYSWSFDDGASSSQQNPDHTYTTSGTYTATVTATDDDGATDSDSVTITVSSPGSSNTPPAASFTKSCSGDTCGFDASGSSDSDGSITSYTWDFGDGTSGSGQTTSHTYSSDGTYTVTLQVTDDDGATDSTTDTVTITTNSAPTASFDSSCSGLSCSFDASGSSDSDGSITSYSWDFGDGTSATGQTASHTYSSDGTYTITLQVTDDSGDTDSDSKTVAVSSSSGGGGGGGGTGGSTPNAVQLKMGQVLHTYTMIENQADEPNTFRVRVDSSMSNGELNAILSSEGDMTNEATIELGPNSQRNIELELNAVRCMSQSCSGQVNIFARSLDQDDTYEDQIDIVIDRDTDVYGGPGITGLHVILLSLLGSAVYLFTRNDGL